MVAERRYQITGGPWPERIGLECTIVPSPAGRAVYPRHGKLASEVVVRLADDPLLCDCDPDESGHMFCSKDNEVWTCVLLRSDLTEVSDGR